jgi:hypothetical protein
MRRLPTHYPVICLGCEADIAGPAVFHVGLRRCRSGCAADGYCDRSNDRDA